MDQTSIKDKIRAFLRDRTKHPDLADDEDYFQAGFVNSLFAMQLVLFVEKEFQLRIGDDDLVIENFNSINSISALVARKQAGGGSPPATP
jgi:methoxymalonate biosynthesis acyl carrier protein